MMGVLPLPTACLPAISKLHGCQTDELQAWVNYLRVLYNPEVRASRRRAAKLRNTAVLPQDLPVDMKDLSQADLDNIRNDSFECSYAIRWLTALISRADCLTDNPEALSGSTAISELETQKVTLEQLIDNAASLLAICAGASASGKVVRLFSFGPSQLGEELSVQLTDAPLESQDFSSVGAQTWGGACVLADMIVTSPSDFGIPLDIAFHYPAASKIPYHFRVLELGSGTGLVGLTVAKLLLLRNIAAKVVLSDFYPSVLQNLKVNIDTNFPQIDLSSVSVDECRLDWELFSNDPKSRTDSLLSRPFDMIFGADIIYEPNHALWIKECLNFLLRRPDFSYDPSATGLPPAFFHLVIPLRRTHRLESDSIEKVFPIVSLEDHCDLDEEAEEPLHLAILHTERFSCDNFSDIDVLHSNKSNLDDIEYAYYRIGWHGR